jgi:DNA-binding MarR family transcriptional regulator
LSRKVQTRREIVGKLAGAVQQFVNRVTLFQSSIAERLQLNPVDLFALFILQKGEATKPSELARALRVPSGTATKIVDRLEKGGFVVRSRSLTDRRGVLLRLVPERIASIELMYQGMGEHFNSFIARASERELRFLLDFLNSSSEAAIREQRDAPLGDQAHGHPR